MGEGGLVTRLRAGAGEIKLGRLSLRVDTARQGGWMLVATVIAGIFNYLPHVFVGRLLGPADYSIFSSLNAFSLIPGIVTGIVQTVVTNYVARLRSRSSVATVATMLVYLLKRLLPWGIAGALALSLVSSPLARILQIPSSLPVIVISLLLIPVAALPVVVGTLRGLQRFGSLGGTQISVGLFRLVTAVGLISLGLGATGAVSSLPLSSLGAFALGMFLLRDVLRQHVPGAVPEIDGLLEYSFHAALALVCFAVLTYGDVILVKWRFTPTEAGLYSAVATLGKTAFWISGAVVMLLLPKATEQHAQGHSPASLVRKSQLAVASLCGSVTILLFLFPSLIVGTFFGQQYVAHASLLGPYALAMMLFSLVNVWLIYYLAVKEKRYAYVLLIGVVLSMASLALYASDLTEVVVILVGVGAVLYLGGELLLVVGERRMR